MFHASASGKGNDLRLVIMLAFYFMVSFQLFTPEPVFVHALHVLLDDGL